MNIADVDRLETDGVETTAGENVLVEGPHILIPNDDRLPPVESLVVRLADGRALKLIKRVARNARATIFRYEPIEEEVPDHGSHASPAD